MTKIAIIGAGIAGLTLAKALKSRADVTVFEKARGVSGRMATRYADTVKLNHGTQFFTARSESFQRFIRPYIDEGVVKRWVPQLVDMDTEGHIEVQEWADPHYIGWPQMNSWMKAVAEGLCVRTETQIEEISGNAAAWHLSDADEQKHGPYDWVISTAPAPQSGRLLPSEFSGHLSLHAVKMQPCFSLMLGLPYPLPLDWDVARISGSLLGWVAANTIPPENSEHTGLLVHTTNEWAEQNLEEDLDAVKQQMRTELQRLIKKDLAHPFYEQVHRWRYAAATIPVGRKFLLDEAHQLAACGDWCLGNRVEAAYSSATALAAQFQELIH